jgi:hypothetical protein
LWFARSIGWHSFRHTFSISIKLLGVGAKGYETEFAKSRAQPPSMSPDLFTRVTRSKLPRCKERPQV